MEQYTKMLEIANAFYDNGEFAKAIEYYTNAIELNSLGADAFEGRGQSYYSILEIEKGIADLSLAIKIDGQKDNAYNNRGVIWLEKKEYQLAKSDFEAALSLKEENIYYLTAFSHPLFRFIVITYILPEDFTCFEM